MYKLINIYEHRCMMSDLHILCTQDLLNRTRKHEFLPWYKTLKQYYQRPEWELYNLKYDPEELNNIALKPSMKVM